MREGNLTIHMVNKIVNPLTYIINNILSYPYIKEWLSYEFFDDRVAVERAEESKINESTGGAYPLDQDFLIRDSENLKKKVKTKQMLNKVRFYLLHLERSHFGVFKYGQAN